MCRMRTSPNRREGREFMSGPRSASRRDDIAERIVVEQAEEFGERFTATLDLDSLQTGVAIAAAESQAVLSERRVDGPSLPLNRERMRERSYPWLRSGTPVDP